MDKIIRCANCGKEFATHANSRPRCCSDECKKELQAKKAKARSENAEASRKRKEAKRSSLDAIMRDAEAHGFGRHYGAYVAYLEQQKTKAGETANG